MLSVTLIRSTIYPDEYCTMVAYSISQRERTRNNFCENWSDLFSNTGPKYGILKGATLLCTPVAYVYRYVPVNASFIAAVSVRMCLT